MHLHLKAAFGGAARLNPTTKRENSLSERSSTVLAQPPLPACTPKAAGCGSLGTQSWKG